MKTNLHKSLSVVLLTWAVLGGLALQAHSETEDRVEKSFPVSAGGQLTVNADRGAIEVTAAEGENVEVEVIRKVRVASDAKAKEILEDHQLTFNHQGANVEVLAKYHGTTGRLWRELWNRLHVRFVISVPKKYNVDLKTAGGSITVSDLTGKVKTETSGGSLKLGRIQGPVNGRTSGGSISLAAATEAVDLKTSGGRIDVGEVEAALTAQTSGGSIKLARAKGDALAKTSGGSITVEEAAAKLEAETSGGSIHLGKIAGPATAHTSGGGIDIAEMSGAVNASTSGGSVSARLTAQPKGDCSLRSSGGGIRVDLSEKVAVDLDARTSGGRVTTDLPVTITVQGEQKSNHLQGKINGGGPALVLKTSGGGIHLRKL